jgi:hypothetical protein
MNVELRRSSLDLLGHREGGYPPPDESSRIE